MIKLTHSERHFLGLLMEEGATISVGTNVGKSLHRRGLVTIARWKRYGITQEGKDAFTGGAAKAKTQERKQALADAQLALL
ncbi:hypothetical protein [Bradyrhizobium sp. Tv2a-2]|uniref:hypothetical protein n=1 Tax=Bradyrhizobium sp. Tv2a-2 TaxID=113395 RepID=UPI0004143420|nr:hypothetical protein [Bradyrhizobium sp. Tv2a-2]